MDHFTQTDRILHSIVHLRAASCSLGPAIFDHSSRNWTEASYGLQVSIQATSHVHVTIQAQKFGSLLACSKKHPVRQHHKGRTSISWHFFFAFPESLNAMCG